MDIKEIVSQKVDEIREEQEKAFCDSIMYGVGVVLITHTNTGFKVESVNPLEVFDDLKDMAFDIPREATDDK